MAGDFHTHTLFSIDAFGTPEMLIDSAKACGITAVSVTEHNNLHSHDRAASRAKTLGIRYFSGIELDCYFNGCHCHILGLGVNPENQKLRSLAARNYSCYEKQFEFYYEFLSGKGFPWSREEIHGQMPFRYPTHPSPLLSVGLLYHFIDHKGKLPEYKELWLEADSRYTQLTPAERKLYMVDFCRFEEALDAIKTAEGTALLAHVALSTRSSFRSQENLICKMMEKGLDGFELYHKTNVRLPWFEKLEDFGRGLGCVLSGGSDFHGRTPYRDRADYGLCDEMAEKLVSTLDEKSGESQ